MSPQKVEKLMKKMMQKEGKITIINFHHIHIIFYVQTVFIYFHVITYILVFIVQLLYLPFLNLRNSLGIFIWDGTIRIFFSILMHDFFFFLLNGFLLCNFSGNKC